MDAIKQNLGDPSWWFSAVFIAILASLFSSYVRDGLSVFFAKVSSAARIRREARLLHDCEEIAFLALHPTLLVLRTLQICIGFVLYAFMSSMTLAIPTMMYLADKLPGTGILLWPLGVPFFGTTLSVILSVITCVAGYSATRQFRVVVDASLEYRERIKNRSK